MDSRVFGGGSFSEIITMFGGGVYVLYITLWGMKNGKITAYINRKKRVFCRGDRYFMLVIVGQCLFAFALFCLGGWSLWARYR